MRSLVNNSALNHCLQRFALSSDPPSAIMLTTFIFVFHVLSGSILLDAKNITNSSHLGCNENKEIQNLAMKKTASQSSAISEGHAYHAVDGNKNPSFDAGSCSSTSHLSGYLPHWWKVDLEQVAIVTHVVIYNRIDDCHCENLLKDFSVKVGKISQEGTENYTECHFHTGPFNGSYLNVTCSRPVCGRFVQIIKQPSDKSALTLCEVEVVGSWVLCTRNFSGIVDECPISTVDHTTTSSVTERTEEISTYTEYPHNTKKNEVIDFSLLSSVSTKRDVGTMTTGQQSMPDTLPGQTFHSTLISTPVSDVIIQEGTNHAMYPQTSPAIEIVTSTKTVSPHNTKKNEVIAVSLLSSVSTKRDGGTMTSGQQSMPDALGERNSQSTLISTAVSDVITQDGTKHTMYLQTSPAVEVVTSSSVSPAKYPLCQCRCTRNVEKNTSAYLALKRRTEKLTKELVENLSIDKKTTTRYMRKLRSVADDRPTAFSMGFVGITFLILVGIAMIVNDITTAVMAIKQKRSVKPEGASDNP